MCCAGLRGGRRNELAGVAAGLQLDCVGVWPGAAASLRTTAPSVGALRRAPRPAQPPRSSRTALISQTGAGKSFSMEGPANNKGLVPRIFQRAFELFSSDADIKSFEISLQFFELYNEQLQARARAPARTQWRVRGRQPARCMGLQPASHHASHVHMHLCGEQAQHHMHMSRPSTGTRRHTAHAAHACSPLAPAGRPRPRLGRQIQAHARPTPSRSALPRRTCSMSVRQWM